MIIIEPNDQSAMPQNWSVFGIVQLYWSLISNATIVPDSVCFASTAALKNSFYVYPGRFCVAWSSPAALWADESQLTQEAVNVPLTVKTGVALIWKESPSCFLLVAPPTVFTSLFVVWWDSGWCCCVRAEHSPLQPSSLLKLFSVF